MGARLGRPSSPMLARHGTSTLQVSRKRENGDLDVDEEKMVIDRHFVDEIVDVIVNGSCSRKFTLDDPGVVDFQ